MRKVNIGIVGAGNIAHCHMQAYQLLENVQVCAVCDIQKQRAQDFAGLYNIPRAYGSHLEMMENEKLDAVSVCTWNSAHGPVSIDVLNRGIHVLCEKPLAMNVAEALAMEYAAQANNCVLMPGFCTRYEDGINLLREQVQSGRLGDVYYIKSTYLRRHGYPGGWFGDSVRSGGGPVIDLGVHVLDLARYVAEGNAISVSASTHKMPGSLSCESASPHMSIEEGTVHDVEDFATALIRMDNGVTVLMETSWNHHIPEDVFQFEVYGTKGGAKAYPSVAVFEDEEGKPVDRKLNHSNHPESPNYDFDREIAHFISVCEGKTSALCTARDGVEVMRIVDALYKSAQSGREILITR